jgi:N-acetylglucosaminyl-diphospho-decaprenol L-rhamnosyltransferase
MEPGEGLDHPLLSLSENVTIAVAAHGNAQASTACLRGILLSAQGDFELILVDDCSPDRDATMEAFNEAKRQHANTVIYQSVGKALEYSGSVNAILSHAKGEYIFFISNDIITTPYYFATILEIAASDPGIGIIRGSSNFVDNELESHNLQPIHPIHTIEDVRREGRDVLALFGCHHIPDVFLTGDAFMVTRALLNKIGTFDPLFYGYFADHDFGVRAQAAGFQTVLAPGAYAYHMQQANMNYLSEAERERKLHRRWTRVVENWARFKVKYGLPVELDYSSIQDIPWASLAAEPFSPGRHYSKPGDYSQLRH